MTDTTPHISDRIVVGVDGSEPSKEALRWALEEAEVRNAPVEAVAAWEPSDESRGLVPHPEAPSRPQQAAYRMLREAVDAVAPEEKGWNAPETVVREGGAAEVLVDQAQGAQMIVVGNRGHGRITEALLGSVSQAVVAHAHCPVVVAHSTQE
jgi:nucleotide-binding universal stress UspA family protein